MVMFEQFSERKWTTRKAIVPFGSEPVRVNSVIFDETERLELRGPVYMPGFTTIKSFPDVEKEPT